jgi:hypothetical protein
VIRWWLLCSELQDIPDCVQDGTFGAQLPAAVTRCSRFDVVAQRLDGADRRNHQRIPRVLVVSERGRGRQDDNGTAQT